MNTTKNYKKELYSLPIGIVNNLVEYAQKTHQKKSHIVAEALSEYIKKRDKEKEIKEALSLIGMISENSPNSQEVKANREDI